MLKYLMIPILLTSCTPSEDSRPRSDASQGFDCKEMVVEVSKQPGLAIRLYECTTKPPYIGIPPIKCYIYVSDRVYQIDSNGFGKSSAQSENSISCVR
jgi:hypothetical protein